jgi:uncharacterized protein (TIGR02444 family)
MAWDARFMSDPSPLRDFALALYSLPSVSTACLKLQDEGGVDVLMLIGLVYADIRLGRPLDAGAITALDRDIAKWRRTVIHPLRLIRVQLKPDWPEVRDDDRLTLREKVKALELQAEFIQLSVIENWLGTHPAATGLPVEQVLPQLLKAGATTDGVLAESFDVVVQAARTLS